MNYTIIFAAIIALFIGCSGRSDSPHEIAAVGSFNRVTNTSLVDEYADREIRPLLPADANGGDLKVFLLIVNRLMDEKGGISENKILPMDFMKLSLLSQKNIIPENAWYLFWLPEQNRNIIRVLHNTYMLEDASGIFFGPTANDVVKYRFAFGCTHYARVFIAVVKSLNLVDEPGSMRYVVSCEAGGYNDYLNKKQKMLNGHQFVIIKIKDCWYAVNTNRKNDYLLLPPDFDPDMNLYERNLPLSFAEIAGKIFLLRKIGKDYNDDCGDFSLRRLKNIYLSGDPHSDTPRWERYRIY